jgi:high-affinity K+ transport system ATPase subunit B
VSDSPEKDYDPNEPEPEDVLRKLIAGLPDMLKQILMARAQAAQQPVHPMLVKIPRTMGVPMIRVGMIANGYLAMYEDAAGKEVHRHFQTLAALGIWAEVYFARFADEVTEAKTSAQGGRPASGTIGPPG